MRSASFLPSGQRRYFKAPIASTDTMTAPAAIAMRDVVLLITSFLCRRGFPRRANEIPFQADNSTLVKIANQILASTWSVACRIISRLMPFESVQTSDQADMPVCEMAQILANCVMLRTLPSGSLNQATFAPPVALSTEGAVQMPRASCPGKPYFSKPTPLLNDKRPGLGEAINAPVDVGTCPFLSVFPLLTHSLIH